MEIKEGEYVVVLVDDNYSNSWKNFCFQQKITWDDVIEPKTTPKYPKNNDGEAYRVTDSMWRYATDEEIERYKVEGHFKITTKPKGPKKSKELNYYEIF